MFFSSETTSKPLESFQDLLQRVGFVSGSIMQSLNGDGTTVDRNHVQCDTRLLAAVGPLVTEAVTKKLPYSVQQASELLAWTIGMGMEQTGEYVIKAFGFTPEIINTPASSSFGGYTPLHMAMLGGGLCCHHAAMAVLLRYGADPATEKKAFMAAFGPSDYTTKGAAEGAALLGIQRSSSCCCTMM